MARKGNFGQSGQKVRELHEGSVQRGNAEKALQESEERFRLAFENANCGMALVGPDGRHLRVNNMLCGMVGYRREELEGMTIQDTTHPEDLDVTADFIQRALDGEISSTTFENRHLHKQGHVVWTRVAGSLVRDSQGKPLYFIFQVQDVTDSKRDREMLREKTRLNRILLDALPCVALLLRSDYEVVITNKAGQDAGAIPGKKCLSPRGQRGDAFPWCLGPMGLDIGEAKHQEVEIRGIVWDAHWVPVGQDLSLFYAFDITEKREMEDRIQQAQRMESLSVLADGIANNFNNLLMAIEGNASLMLLDKDSYHPDYEKLKNIEHYVKNGAKLTRQLLAFAIGEKYEVKQTDLNDLVKRTSEMFGHTKREITILSKYQQEIWLAQVDQSQIEQVLVNLYVNAADAMPAGGKLYLQTENAVLDENYVRPYGVEPGSYVRISVADTGVGMDRITQERIFDPFFTTKEMGKGTGLGLSAAYGIINNHGGIINASSEKGKGTTFHIYLPAKGAKSTEQRAESEDEVEFFGGSETILLVDDEEMIIDVDKQMLEKMGYRVYRARSGREAIDIYKKNMDHIDMVILDMIMPEMGGGDTYDRLKGVDPDVKVLLSSGYSLEGQVGEILERGCNGFIQKPFNIKGLSLKIREILDKE